MTDPQVAEAFLASAKSVLESSAKRIAHCVEQLDDEQLWWRPTPDQNSVGNLLLHLCGNLRQWVIAGVGGAADDRDRPAEFSAQGGMSPDQALAQLQSCVQKAAATLDSTDPPTLLALRRIQGFEVTGLSAIFDSLSHFQGHTQEIVSLTRQQLGDRYRFHWAPSTPEEGA